MCATRDNDYFAWEARVELGSLWLEYKCRDFLAAEEVSIEDGTYAL